jgi:MFS family permease
MSLLSDYHHGTRTRALGFHQTSVYIGTIAGGAFAGLIGQHYGWRWSFVVFGSLGVLLGLVLTKALREPVRSGQGSALPLTVFLKEVLVNPPALLLMVAFLCANFVALVLLSWMPQFLVEKFHLSLAASGLTATIFVQLASMLAAPIGGWLADRLRQRTPAARMLVQAGGVLCGAPFVFLCGWTRSILWLIVALIAWGFFKGLYDANIFASLFDVVRPEARGTAAGFMNMIGWLGGGIAPVTVGYIARASTLSTAISLTAVVYVLAFIALSVAARLNSGVGKNSQIS